MCGCRVMNQSNQDTLGRNTNAYHRVSVSESYHHHHHWLSLSGFWFRCSSGWRSSNDLDSNFGFFLFESRRGHRLSLRLPNRCWDFTSIKQLMLPSRARQSAWSETLRCSKHNSSSHTSIVKADISKCCELYGNTAEHCHGQANVVVVCWPSVQSGAHIPLRSAVKRDGNYVHHLL
jgi:hypothetical protein